MRRFMNSVRTAAFVAAAGATAAAYGATACVSNSAQLALVLAAAQSNGEDDVINLEVGDYALSGELVYFAGPNETHSLTIIGGQVPGCGPYASSGLTTLDGQNAVRMLSITAKGAVNIGRITFSHGQPSQYAGGALNIVNTSTAPTYIFSNSFVANTDANIAGAVYVSSTGDVYFWSNLLIANNGPSALALYDYGITYITGNTFIANSLVNHAGIGGALNPQGPAQYYVSNNILWNNESADVYDQSGLVDYAYNDVGVITNYPAHSQSHDISVDPDFDGFLSVQLAPASPLVNAGLDNPPGGVGGCCDPSGSKRVVGTHVDIGAYESDVLLRTGFQ